MPPSTESSNTHSSGRLGGSEQSNGKLILRLLALTWQFKYAALYIVLLQMVLLALALSGLGFTGLGIDVIRHHLFPDTTEPPGWPLGLNPPAQWHALATVGFIAGLIFAIAAIRFVLDRNSQIAKAELVQSIVVHLRAKVYNKLQHLSFRFFDDNESGSIINRVTGDVQAVRLFVDGVMIEVLMMILSLVFFLGFMIRIHPGLTLACLATTPVLWVLTIVFSRIVRPAYKENRELFDRAVRVLSENTQGVHVVKGFGLQRQENEKFRVANNAVSDQQRWIFRKVSFFVPLISFLPQINLLVLLVYGGWLVIDGQIEFGTGLVVFSGLLQQFSGQVGNIAQIANSVQRSLTGAQRVFEVIDAPLEIQSPPDAKPLKRAKGQVRFENVTFSYQRTDEPELIDVNFEAEPGSTTAILGATGAGKSTLLSLIPRFYDPQIGKVLIDGVDVREYLLDDLRRNIGIVFQESFLFSHTVAENIAFGHPKATREQIEKAARIAAAHEFITELPQGYDTRLAEAGGNLSGGQRQRLAIARAILLEPPILLLDDPTAAIDPETESDILEAMNEAMKGRTTFVVAHRLSTMRRADQVLVLENGRIAQRGTHQELMNTGGHYQHAAKLQLADAESKRLLGMRVDDGDDTERLLEVEGK